MKVPGAQALEDQRQSRTTTVRSTSTLPSRPSCRSMIEPGFTLGEDLVGDQFASVVVPVLVRDVPHRHAHVVIAHDALHHRRACHRAAAGTRPGTCRCPLECLLRALELGVAGIEPAPLVVVVRVVAEQLAVRVEVARDLRLLVDRLADLEEGSLDVGVVEDLHDLRCRADIRPVVERERDLVFVTVAVHHAAAEPRRAAVFAPK